MIRITSDSPRIAREASVDEPRTPKANGGFSPLEPRQEGKYFNDPVHDGFTLQPVTCAIVDTRPFQRLRYLKQLGFSYWVYPGASHNRFEHSLGVGHLAGKWAETLMQRDHEPHQDIQRCSTLLEIAGACHDLGHGPFSHTWERYILPALGVQNWSSQIAFNPIDISHCRHHEDMSARLVESIFDSYDIYDRFEMTRSDVQCIQALISGHKPDRGSYGVGNIPVYLYDIVNNRDCGIDVDKMDYLQRDSLHTNVKISAPYRRFLDFTKTEADGILYRMRELENLAQLFRDRRKMHRMVYTHKTSRAFELMFADIVKEVGAELCIPQRVHVIPEFLKLKDSLLEFIYEHHPSDTPGAQRAKALCKRLEERDHYRLCGEMPVPEPYIQSVLSTGVDPIEITSQQRTDGQVDLRPDDIHVSVVSMHYGMGCQNPLEKVRVYQERLEEISALAVEMRPTQMVYLRVYCKQRCHEEAVRAAFENYRRHCGFSSLTLTPDRRDQRADMEMLSD